MSIWHWTYEFASDAYAKGDSERVRLASLHNGTFDLMQSHPDQAISILEEGATLARRLNEPWWALFYEHWKLQVLLFHKRDYSAALDLAIRCAIEVRKPIYAHFPQRVCLHEDLISAYVGSDGLGHADKIEAALQYMESETDPDSQCFQCLLQCRSEFEIEMRQWDKANDATLRALQDADNAWDNMHRLIACANLCQIAWARGDWNDALQWARDGEDQVRGSYDLYLVEVIMWRAAAEQHVGDPQQARRAFTRAMTKRRRLGASPGFGFYQAACAYHEALGDFEGALRVLDEELQGLNGKGQSGLEARRRLKRCALLAQSGRSWHEERARTEEVARRLVDPSPILHELHLLSQRYS